VLEPLIVRARGPPPRGAPNSCATVLAMWAAARGSECSAWMFHQARVADGTHAHRMEQPSTSAACGRSGSAVSRSATSLIPRASHRAGHAARARRANRMRSPSSGASGSGRRRRALDGAPVSGERSGPAGSRAGRRSGRPGPRERVERERSPKNPDRSGHHPAAAQDHPPRSRLNSAALETWWWQFQCGVRRPGGPPLTWREGESSRCPDPPRERPGRATGRKRGSRVSNNGGLGLRPADRARIEKERD